MKRFILVNVCTSLTCQLTTLKWPTVTVSVGRTRTTTRGSVLVIVRLIRVSVQDYTTLQQPTIGLSLIRRQRFSVNRTTSPSQWRFNRLGLRYNRVRNSRNAFVCQSSKRNFHYVLILIVLYRPTNAVY